MLTVDSVKYLKTTFILGLAGVLFAGYLSATKLFTSACALNETCPYFLGLPACYYGFVMFSVIFGAAVFGLLKKITSLQAAKIQAAVSFLGILFAGSFTVPEIDSLLSGTSTYTLGLPTCAYGLIFYVIVFILSLRHLRAKPA